MRLTSLKPVVFALCLVLSISLTWNYSYWRHLQADRSVELRRSSRRTVSDIYIALIETESAQRGYIITGNILDADLYHAGVDRVYEARREAEPYIAAMTPEQKKLMVEFDDLLKQKMDEMQMTIQLYREQGPSSSIALVRSQKGLRLMNRIRELKDLLRDSLYKRPQLAVP